MINRSSVRVVGSNAECLQFPMTVQLQDVTFSPGTMRIRSTGAPTWPMVPVNPGEEPVQAATLWVFLRINDVWYATGAERLRPTQINGNKPAAKIDTIIGEDWLYDKSRWGIMTGYNPESHEAVGFMLVSGSTRSDDTPTVKERSNIVVMEWKTDNVLWSEEPEPVPASKSSPRPKMSTSTAAELEALREQVVSQQRQLDQLASDVRALATIRQPSTALGRIFGWPIKFTLE